MAYYLTIKENQNHKLLNISNLEEFKRLSKFKNESYSLQEIDIFTSHFEDEITIKRKLYESGVITSEDITKDISIRKKNKGVLEKVRYGLVYKEMSKFLQYQELRFLLLALQEDTIFLKKLLDHYRNCYKQEGLRQINALLRGYQDTDINMYSALNLFYNDQVIIVNRKTGEIKLQYKPLHDLGMFIFEYLSKNGKSTSEIEEEKEERIRALLALKTSLVPVEEPKKKKIKTKELEGQISFF